MTVSTPALVVPDRFESLERRAAENELSSIVVPVDEGLELVDRIYQQMGTNGRGAFLILRGASGAGKSTFLHTLRLFRDGVTTVSVPGGVSIRETLQAHKPSSADLEVFVLEEREAAISFSDQELEEWLHAINGFIRSARGEKALVVWPCNTDQLRDRIVLLASQIGAEALVGIGQPAFTFLGPAKQQFAPIAEKTVAVLNQGATFSDLGLSISQVEADIEASTTIGGFLARLGQQIGDQESCVKQLLRKEQCRLWIIVIAGNEPDAFVGALTRGRYAAIDTERLMSSTEANIVTELKGHPERIGILGTVLDARILYLPVLAILDIVRAFSDESLRLRMKNAGLSLKPDNQQTALSRLDSTELAQIFKSGAQGTLAPGPKVGSSSLDAFSKVAKIASTNDAALNRTIGRALQAAGLIDSFEVEQDFGNGLKRRTDILGQTSTGPIRIEVMWRERTSRAAIANYVLTKLAKLRQSDGIPRIGRFRKLNKCSDDTPDRPNGHIKRAPAKCGA